MTAEPSDSGEGLPNGSSPPVKRGRGRPKGSVKKTKFNLFQRTLARVPKVVEFFNASGPKEKVVRKRGRPKKRLRGRPRKTPLSPEEEAERRLMQQLRPRRRRLWKPLGRPRIHPLVPPTPKEPRKRGRPRKVETVPSCVTYKLDADGAANPPANGTPLKRGRGRPPGSTNKTPRLTFGPVRKRGRPRGSGKIQVETSDGPPRKRGRPPGSKRVHGTPLEQGVDGPPRKRGRPRGSGSGSAAAKRKPEREDGATPRKRGRPPGSLGKKKRHWKAKILEPKPTYDGPPRKRGRPPKVKPADLTSSSETAEQEQPHPQADKEEGEISQAAASANGNAQPAIPEGGNEDILAPVEDEDELQGGHADEDDVTVIEETAVSKGSSSGKRTPVTMRGTSSGRSRAV